MARARANGVELEYEITGPEQGEAVLLINGLGTQLISWPDSLIDGLAGHGFRVIAYDNRDAGLSTRFDAAGPADLAGAFAAARAKQPVQAPYRLEDMADDAAGLLDALGIDSAHVVGVSMGGMIAQTLVVNHPERIRSLVSIMSTVAPWIGAPREDVLGVLLAPPASDLAGYEQQAVDTWRTIGSPAFSFDENRVRELARRIWSSGYDPVGVGRQLLAIQASGDRTEALGRVDVPTAVIHGDSDPLVQHPGGVATAEAIPGAELETIEGMGHDLPPELFELFADRVAALARRVEAGASITR